MAFAGGAMSGEVHRTEYRSFNLRIANRDLPRAMIFVGVAIALLGAVDMMVPPRSSLVDFGGIVVAGTMLALSGLALRRVVVPFWLVPWVFCGVAVAFVGFLLYVFVKEPNPSNLAFVIIAVTAYGPMSFNWPPFLVGNAVFAVFLVFALVSVHIANLNDWLVGSATAFLTSGVLLAVRLRLLRELADAEHANALLSAIDPLTGLLNRRGLEERLGQIWADAVRRAEPITLCFVDIRGLKRANDDHGHEFGDLVIRDAADALRATVRGSDLAARWGGDEFVIVGLGSGIEADSLSDRLNSHLKAHGLAQRRDWSGDVTVGVAVAFASEQDFTAMVRAADAEMYARRAGS